MKRRLDRSIAVLAWNWVAARPSSGRIIACAQRLKAAGHSALAYDLMSRGLDEKDAPENTSWKRRCSPRSTATSASPRGSSRGSQPPNRPTPSRARNSPRSCPRSSRSPAYSAAFSRICSFSSMAKERRFFRKAMGEDGVNLDEAFCDEETRIFDLAPEMTSEFAPWSDPALREEITGSGCRAARTLGLSGEMSGPACLRFCTGARSIASRYRVDARAYRWQDGRRRSALADCVRPDRSGRCAHGWSTAGWTFPR